MRRRILFVYGAPLDQGGLGIQSANALRALARTADVHAVGPGPGPGSSTRRLPHVTWHVSPRSPAAALRWTPLRRHAGLGQLWADRRIGAFAAKVARTVRPDLCYTFTQVGLETLRWARAAGVHTIVESPNGHIRPFRAVYTAECARWCNSRFLGHPTPRMVTRVERELAVADRIRVSSCWSRASLVAGGVDPNRIGILQQPVDLQGFPALPMSEPGGPLRVCFVGTLDFRKGFVYLLKAARRSAPDVSLQIVGATGDRRCRQLLERERAGVDVHVAPGDPRTALARAEVFVLPTLEDGSPFAVAEAMASGRPVITTTSTGAAEWVRPFETGWIVPPANDEALAGAFRRAIDAREALGRMGVAARADTERRAGERCADAFVEWVRRC